MTLTLNLLTLVGAVLIETAASAPPNSSGVLHPKARSARAGSAPSSGITFEQRMQHEHEVQDAILRLDVPKLELPAGAVQAGPLVCLSPKHDFGSFWAQGRVSHTFEVRNVSAAPIEVRMIAACACPGGASFWITPGGTLKYPVSLKTEALHDRFTKSIKVQIVGVGVPPEACCPIEVRVARWLWRTVGRAVDGLRMPIRFERHAE